MISKHRNRIMAAALTLSAAVVPAWIHFAEEQAPTGGATAGPAVQASRPARPSTKAALAASSAGVSSPWRVGTKLRYSLEFGSTLESLGGEPTGDDLDARSLSLTGSGKLTLTVSRVDAQALVLTGRVSGLAVALGNDKAAEHRLGEHLTDGIQRPFLLTLSPRGHIEALAVQRDVRGMPHGLLRSIVAALQFVGADTPAATQWETLESDQYGQYKARYRAAEPLHVTKTKLEYTRLAIAETLQVGNQATQTKVDSETDLELDVQGLLRRVAMREAMLLPLGDGGFKTQAYTTLMLEHVGEGAPDLLASSDLVAEPLWHTRGSESITSDIERKRALVDGKSFTELSSKLEAVRSREAGSERIDLMTRMTALLDLDPGAIDELTARVRAGAPKEDQDLLLGALSDSSAPAAQNALAELARDVSLPEELRGDAVSHLGFQEHPSDETFATLEELSNSEGSSSVHGSATLALGGAARRAKEAGESTAAADRAVSALVRKAGAATTPEAQRNAIDALGNSGSTEALPAIRNALMSPSPVVRAAAVSALRNIPGEEAERLVAKTLRSDSEELVRGAAANTVRTREFTPFSRTTAVEALGADEAAGVRMTLVGVIGGWLRLEPTLRAVLERTAASDASNDVRTAAAEILKNGSNQGG